MYRELMMDPYDRYELMVNGTTMKTPLVLSSMAGIVDAEYVKPRSDAVGMACIGGYSIDETTMAASRALAEAGREEFLYDNAIAALSDEVAKMAETGVICALNLRGSSPSSYRAVADAIGPSVVYEIDAHCRQEPMIAAGCGEYLLKNPDQLYLTIAALKDAGVTVSVKIRAGVAEDDKALARGIWQAGADILHVDLMDFGHTKLRQIRNSCPLLIIANNSINTFGIAKDMLAHGADMISLARQAGPENLRSIAESLARYADETGWYNAPKQLCRGGDIRSLTFCCMPVKQCPLLPTLEHLDISRNEFMSLKLDLVKKTPLAAGENTCFGSLAWCCKSSTPCMFRNMALKQEGLSLHDYMRYKHRLADKLMERVFDADGYYATE
ncbi:methanogenesis marker 9 domain-containing protein [Methanovulcanius yangii]|uniref:methanogenesis marker 9 domain-containing protein n=1 Tax=Methanovulcanius yangii TaxID=1789227 RepID=UPI0029CA1EB0|nr:methanogenesis marker 9 domain-containing protein [Methanovulcanius yangii]